MLPMENSISIILQRLQYQKLSAILGIRKGVNIEFIMILGTQTQCLIVLLIFSNAVRIHLNMET